MLHAKEQYIKHLTPRDEDATSFTLGLRADVIWLHNSFNMNYIQKPLGGAKNVVDGVIIIGCPSFYKVGKAITILKERGWMPAINGASGGIDEWASVIFYYAALLLEHAVANAQTSIAMYVISPRQRCDIMHVKKMAVMGMTKDHERRMKEAEVALDDAIDTMLAQRALLKALQKGWEQGGEG